MVLIPRIICLSVCLLLGACSALNHSRSDNRTPVQAVIPVQKTSTPSETKVDTSTETQQQNKPAAKAAPAQPSVKEINTSPKPRNVLDTIKASARKAIEEKQWLRGQYHLDHALRVEPQDAEIYYLYSLVYQGLGAQELQINMLKRAKFLAKSTSDVYHLASEALDALK